MLIPKDEFIDVLYRSCDTLREHSFAYWKLVSLAQNGSTHYLPESGCYYSVYNDFLFHYISTDGKCHLSAQELNQFDCIMMESAMFESIQNQLNGFNISASYKLHYDFNYPLPPADTSVYSIVPFDFNNENHYALAARMINQDEGDWFGPENIKKIAHEPVFDPSLWFFARRNSDQKLVGIAISSFDTKLQETDIEWFYVLPEFHNQGAGRFLINETLHRSIERSKDIRVGGTNEFYKRCGFVERESTIWASKDGFSLYAPSIQPNILP